MFTSKITVIGRNLTNVVPKKKVVVTAKAFNETYDILRNAGFGEIVKNESTEPWSHDELISKSHDANAILAFMTDRCDKELLDACTNLKIISCALKGYDNFDIDLCTERDVIVTAIPDLLTNPTAEMAILLALGLCRRIREADEVIRTGSFHGWRPTLYGTGLSDSIVGIYGVGAIGKAVAKRIYGFDPNRILYFDPVPLSISTCDKLNLECADSLDELMQSCDVLFICTPLNSSTYHSINKKTLSLVKPGLQLINVSRGSCVDERAVADALEAGKLAGYASDVYEFEDWVLKNRPHSIDERLVSHPCTLFSPHLGSAVASTRRKIECAAAKEIVRWKDGEQCKYRVN